MRSLFFLLFLTPFFLSISADGQLPVKTDGPVIVQPGAPGSATRNLPADTLPVLPALTAKDVEFMRGMIMHHAQAVEMTAMIASRTTNPAIRLLGAKISQSQSDEMAFMRKWLAVRGFDVDPESGKHPANKRHRHAGSTAGHDMKMPGMLSQKQMDDLANAEGNEFVKLFLAGMIQHHEGALVMVKELFETPGSGQDAELFNFATDVDTGQTAEIQIMRKMLGEINR